MSLMDGNFFLLCSKSAYKHSDITKKIYKNVTANHCNKIKNMENNLTHICLKYSK